MNLLLVSQMEWLQAIRVWQLEDIGVAFLCATVTDHGGCAMVSLEQIEALKAKHAKLDKAIDDEAHRPLPDTQQIHLLKREKLKIKDEIARLSHS